MIDKPGKSKVKNVEKSQKSPAAERVLRAEGLLAEIFEQAGWRVERQPKHAKSELKAANRLI